MPNPSAILTRLPVTFQTLRREAGPLFLLVILAGALWSFVELAGEVGEGEIRSVDETLLLSLRVDGDPTDPLGAGWVEELARDVTALGSMVVLVFATAAATVYLLLIRKRGAALLMVIAVGGGTVVSTVLKMSFERQRPDLVPHAMETFTASFPSGHAMLAAVTWLTLGALTMRMQHSRVLKSYFLVLALLTTIAVGISRVYLGVHWPSDVLAGWCIGAAWAVLCWLVAVFLQRRGQIEEADEPEPDEAGR